MTYGKSSPRWRHFWQMMGRDVKMWLFSSSIARQYPSVAKTCYTVWYAR